MHITIAQRIKSLRLAAGWTAHELSQRAGISPQSVKNIENKTHSPDLKTAIKISKSFNMNLSELVGETTIRKNKKERLFYTKFGNFENECTKKTRNNI